jgi:hypothetical protein
LGGIRLLDLLSGVCPSLLSCPGEVWAASLAAAVDDGAEPGISNFVTDGRTLFVCLRGSGPRDGPSSGV